MTEKMKTVCVGRFLVDVPAHADLGISGEMISGFAIETTEESETAFRHRLEERETEIRSHGTDATTGGQRGMVDAHDFRVPGLVGRSFVFDRDRGYVMNGDRRIDMESVSVEVHGHLDGMSFSLSASSTQEASVQEAEALLSRLHLRDEDEIPSVPGFCIWRGIFVEPLPGHTTEHITLHLGLPGHPDMGLAFSSIPGGRNSPGLLARVAAADAEASADELLRVTTLRAGKRGINGIDGEEVLEGVRELNFTTGYNFMWESDGVKDNPMRPYLLLNMETGTNPRPGGRPVDSSLHQDAVLDLWDRISSSIRLRPSGPPPMALQSPDPAPPKLGALTAAGETCPKSGWWQCDEAGPGVDVQGGTVQWFNKGERMPQALLLPRQTLWQKLRGLQPSIEPTQLTTWKLVDQRLRPRMPTVVGLAQPGMPAPAAEIDVMTIDGRGVQLGTNVRTGESCPTSGWWLCEEANALDGARWFARGSTLPAATFQVPDGMFARSSGPQVIQRRSTWRLMRYADAELVGSRGTGDEMSGSEAVLRPVVPPKLT